MNKYFYIACALALFMTGFFWASLVLSLVIAFRYAAYMFPFVIMTLITWMFEAPLGAVFYVALVVMLLSIVWSRTYFRFAI